MTKFEPKIVGFVCNWCTYAGADLAGVTRTQYRPNIRIVRVPCTGRIDPLFIIKAFENGVDGVLISGCHPGDCHYISGNFHAKRRWIFFKGLTDFIGIEPERIQYAWVSAAEANKWARMVDEVTESIAKLGPFTRYQDLKKPVPDQSGTELDGSSSEQSEREGGAPSGFAGGGGDASPYNWNEAWLPGIAEDVPLPEEASFVPAIREKARELLESGEVKVIIGYGWAKRQRRVVPVFITRPEEVSRLVFNSLCVNNLSVYLPKKQGDIAKMGKPAIIAKGCDIKTIVVLLQEEQVARDGVVILGVSCSGVVYRQELWKGKMAPDLLAPKCTDCDVKTPHLADHVIGESVAGGDASPWKRPTSEQSEREGEAPSGFAGGGGDASPWKRSTSEQSEREGEAPSGFAGGGGDASPYIDRQIELLDQKSPGEKFGFWKEQFDRCIKCYACSQVCPLCYCDRCITEKNNPQWVECSAHSQGNFSWNLVRAIHLAGRCTYCGECDRVCPVNIPLNLINRKLGMVSEKSFGYRSGYDEKAHPPMVVFNPEDKENFIR